MAGDSTKHILQALGVNSVIACAKGVAAAYTGSGAMLAETIHSAADCCNQLLLLLGVKRSKKPASAEYPLGHGRSLYFWSFMVALLLFAGGGVFSIYEGLHKMEEPQPLEYAGIAVLVLVFSIVLEGYATWSNMVEINLRRGQTSLFTFLRRTKDSDLVVVFGENLAATLGLFLALIALVIAWATGNTWWDGFGSFMIGVVLIIVALFLAVEVKSLLIGETADPGIEATVKAAIAQDSAISKLLHILTLQQGPGQVLLLLKLGFRSGLDVEQVAGAINQLEDRIRQERPEVKWCFVEPDRPRG